MVVLKAYGAWRWLPALARIVQQAAEAGAVLHSGDLGEPSYCGISRASSCSEHGGHGGRGDAMQLVDQCWAAVLQWVAVLCAHVAVGRRAAGENGGVGQGGGLPGPDTGATGRGQEAFVEQWQEGSREGPGLGSEELYGLCIASGGSSGGGGGGGAGGTLRCRCWREFLLREVGVVGLVGSALRELVPRLVGRAAQLTASGPAASVDAGACCHGAGAQEAAEALRLMNLVAAAAILVANEFWDEQELQAAVRITRGAAAHSSRACGYDNPLLSTGGAVVVTGRAEPSTGDQLWPAETLKALLQLYYERRREAMEDWAAPGCWALQRWASGGGVLATPAGQEHVQQQKQLLEGGRKLRGQDSQGVGGPAPTVRAAGAAAAMQQSWVRGAAGGGGGRGRGVPVARGMQRVRHGVVLLQELAGSALAGGAQRGLLQVCCCCCGSGDGSGGSRWAERGGWW